MVSIDLDITLLIQAANFLIAMVVLNLVLIRPIRDILKKRREVMNGLLKESEGFTSLADSRLNNYEAELDAARTRASAQKEQIRQQGLDSEQSILGSAQQEAQSLLQKSRKEISQSVENSMRVLRGQVDELAGKAVSRILN
ncbi:MAG: ATP synthase F0 subunit B [Deltaproteobacteria bacterium]|jgi:F-type H+-transporting ATPase subunit b|nr:ATP synthase F0 subunit B [Deltaproteobacteria bacterium]